MPVRVGVVAAWFDPDDPSVWSGVAHGIVGELRRLGVYAGWRDATPWAPGARALHRWTGLTRREGAWTLRPEMRALSTVTTVARRRRTPADVDAWVHFVGAFGDVVRTRYATVFDMSPTQLAASGPALAESFGYPGVTQSQLDWVASQQARAHERAHACCVPSRWAADSLVRDHGIPAGRVHVVGYARNAEIAGSPERDWTVPRFLFVGRDWHRKNGAAVVRAFQRLRSVVPSARLDLVGDHPAVDVEGVVGHGPIGVHEPCGKAQLEALFASATCFVVPSLLEPFGIVYVEAATAGVPSIAGIHGGTADSVGDGGVLVDPTDDEALFEAMRRLADPDEARALGAAAQARAELFTWPKVGQRVLRSLDLDGMRDVELAEPL